MTIEDYEGAGRSWPVAWSAVWIGALSAFALALVIGLLGTALGAHQAANDSSWRSIRLITLVFNIGGAFFSFVLGGWVASRIVGFRRAEPAMLHGAIVWLIGVPLLLSLAVLGGAGSLGWWGGLGPARLVASGQGAAEALRNAALGGAVALLLGLVGAVVGGWMASGEPMTFTYHRRRTLRETDEERPRRVA
jgi:hypothetical protein